MSTRELYISTDAPGFWSCDVYSCDDGDEQLINTEPDEAVEDRLDSMLSAKTTDVLADLRRDYGETVKVYGYKRMKLRNDPNPERILEDLLERIDEEHGNPEEATEPTQAMKAAAETFAYVVRSEYVVWACERTHEATVNIEAWVRAYRPDWLEKVL